MRKKLLAAILTAATFMTVVPCITNAEEAQEPITLHLATQADHAKTNEDGEDALLALMAPYLEANNIELEITYIAKDSWQDYMTKLQTMIASGNTPDLLYVPAEGENMGYEMGITTSLQPYLDAHPEIVEEYEASVPEGLRNATIHDGECYGLVHLWENSVLWLNKSRLAEAGLEVPDVNWTWDEFETYCEALSDPANGKYAIAAPASYFVYNQWLYSFGTGYVAADDFTEVTFDSEASAELLGWWADAVEKGWATTFDPTGSLSEAQQLMNGTVAMCNTGRWSIATFAANEFTDVAAVYVPVKESDKKSYAFASYQVCEASEHYEEAAALAAWTSSYEFVSKEGSICGEIPSRYDCMVPEELAFEFENQEIFFDMPANAAPMQNPSYFAEIGNVWQNAYTTALAGETDAVTACADAAAEMRDIISYQ